jgi:RNA polymerase sigma-70 factor (ECF subfamily)
MGMEHSFRARIRAGDAEAFGNLFDDNVHAIYRYASRLSGEASTAEDVVAQTFLEAWRLRETVLVEGGSLQPWLYGIATNVLRNARRTVRRHRAALARLPRPEPTPDIADEPARRAGEQEELAAARTALGALRPPEREVVALCIWSGLSYVEAAEALGVPVGTVRSRLSRARTRLQELAREELRALRGSVELQVAGGQVQGVSTPLARPSEEEEP